MMSPIQISPRLRSLVDGWIGDFLMNTFLRIRVFGEENLPRDGAILAPNHPSILDPPLLLLSIYKKTGRFLRFVAWAGLLEKPVYGDILREADVIPVNPPGATGSEEIKKAYPISKTNKMVMESLEMGEWIGVFPEGTNHLFWDGASLYPIQKGILLWAALSKKPIIPIGLRNTHLIWPMLANIDLKEYNFQTWVMAPIVLPVQVEVHIGKPIFVSKEELKDSVKSDKKIEEITLALKDLGNLV